MSTEVKVTVLPKCDLCGSEAHYDGKTNRGPWAYMCEQCFSIYGIGLGTGKGQRLVVTAAVAPFINRVVWRGPSPLRATIHKPSCRVLKRLPASGQYATHQEYTEADVVRRVAAGSIGLCGICGTRQEFS